MNRRVLAFIVCAGLILALLASSLFIFVEADHDCSGENCATCAHMAAVQAFLHEITRLSAAVSILASLCLLRLFLPVRPSAKRRFLSLVALRVRLDI